MPAQARLQALHIAADLRPDVGVHHRGRHALELAVLAQDVVRQRQINARHRLLDHRAGDALVLRIGVGVQEAHRHRLDAGRLQRAAGLGDARLLQRRVDLAGRQHALDHLAGVAPRHQRLVAVEEQVVGLRPVAAADDVDVAGAARHHQAGLGALALDQRVDRGGRAVDQLVDRAGVDAAFLEAVDDALGQLRRRGQALGLHEGLRGLVESDQVGEGAADIDRNDNQACTPTESGPALVLMGKLRLNRRGWDLARRPYPQSRSRSMPASFRQIIDKAVKEKRFLVVPGAHDALSARIIQKIGFETYFIGGFPAVGARYGVPDIGLKGFGEIAACVRDIMAACDLPVFVDGDDGYGDVKNVVHTVQSYERMGVSAILIEDQQWPKRCGHMVGKKVVPTEIAEAKIKAACSERINPETWILARTDARAVYDLDEAMRRAEQDDRGRRRRHLHRGAAQPRGAEAHRQGVRRAADLQPADGRPHADPQHGGAGRARLQLRGARPRHRDARRQGGRGGAARHEVGQVRAAQQRHEFRGVQEGGRLRQVGERRRALCAEGSC